MMQAEMAASAADKDRTTKTSEKKTVYAQLMSKKMEDVKKDDDSLLGIEGKAPSKGWQKIKDEAPFLARLQGNPGLLKRNEKL